MILLALALLAADPGSAARVIAGAAPGDTVRLVPGRYPTIVVKNRAFSPPLTIDATGASVASVVIGNSSGVNWKGGTIVGDTSQPVAGGFGILAKLSTKITITGAAISYFRSGIVFDQVDGGTISGNALTAMSSDGIDIALSRNVMIDHNACSNFNPSDGAHPDCIQAWSRPGFAPTSDLKIYYNTAVGAMQGVSFFNHTRDGIDDGGYDRIKIVGNTVLNLYGAGIALVACRDCVARENSVSSLPDYYNKAQLWVTGGSVEQCGNDVPMVPRQATPPCKTPRPS